VIKKDQMMSLMTAACPSFRPIWDEYLADAQTNSTEPLTYLALADLARQVIAMFERGDTKCFAQVFDIVERWHVEGEHCVREAATVGFLESLQNRNLHTTTEPEQFHQFLRPESERWWDKLYDFWQRGMVMTDDR
jgi:hypothetical protein